MSDVDIPSRSMFVFFESAMMKRSVVLVLNDLENVELIESSSMMIQGFQRNFGGSYSWISALYYKGFFK
ncbi:MAG: hypothetical protein CL912_12730 [Deltaproteobacteria bacterium]|nr:hypothetical protein [Deltaproteobacteria bacterium]|tara:strand:- start:284 stop:490 length:207 start_codon:yes stop_codon:yes gene_type:complete